MVGLACAGCTKKPPPEEQGPRKPRVDVVVTLPKAPPASREFIGAEDGVHIALVGVPSEGELEPLLRTAVHEAEYAGSNATVVVSTRCLRDLQPALEKNEQSFWTLAAVVGARCEGAGPSKSTIGAAVLIEAGGPPKVRITFDRHTRAFVKVEPLP